MQSRYHDVGGRTITLVAVTSLPRDPWGERTGEGFFLRQETSSRSHCLMMASLAFDVLHHDEIDAVLLADVVEGADVGVVELRKSLWPRARSGPCAPRTLGEVLGGGP